MTKATIGAGELPALNKSRLFQLPKLADVRKQAEKPNIDPPNFELKPVPVPGCVNCKKQLTHEPEFSQCVKVCRECLKVYSVVTDALNRHSEQKAIAAKRNGFVQKLNFEGDR